VKAIPLVTAFLASLSSAALAQESAADELWTPASIERMLPAAAPAPDPDPEPEPSFAFPSSLKDEPASFSMGPEGGYLRARNADRGTWFGGVKARLHLAKILAAEASITFHQNRYADGDVIVTQYPLQLTAFLYIIPEGPIRPYILGGVGWYYTRVDYRDTLSLIKDETDHFFGVHLGAGAELMLGPRTSLDADVRYIFVNASTEQVVEDHDFNYWQITFGLNFYF